MKRKSRHFPSSGIGYHMPKNAGNYPQHVLFYTVPRICITIIIVEIFLNCVGLRWKHKKVSWSFQSVYVFNLFHLFQKVSSFFGNHYLVMQYIFMKFDIPRNYWFVNQSLSCWLRRTVHISGKTWLSIPDCTIWKWKL